MQLTNAVEQFETVNFIKLKPILKSALEEIEKTRQRYHCPAFRTTVRKGVLTTTGHSSNYIFDVLMDCEGAEGKSIAEKKELV